MSLNVILSATCASGQERCFHGAHDHTVAVQNRPIREFCTNFLYCEEFCSMKKMDNFCQVKIESFKI